MLFLWGGVERIDGILLFLKEYSMSKDQKNKDLVTQLWGWILFLICSALFIISGVRARDVVTTAASVIFFLGCVVFVIPLIQAIRREE
jgi:choline-glycine betaine transporter